MKSCLYKGIGGVLLGLVITVVTTIFSATVFAAGGITVPAAPTSCDYAVAPATVSVSVTNVPANVDTTYFLVNMVGSRIEQVSTVAATFNNVGQGNYYVIGIHHDAPLLNATPGEIIERVTTENEWVEYTNPVAIKVCSPTCDTTTDGFTADFTEADVPVGKMTTFVLIDEADNSLSAVSASSTFSGLSFGSYAVAAVHHHPDETITTATDLNDFTCNVDNCASVSNTLHYNVCAVAPNTAPAITQPGLDPAAISVVENTTVVTDVNTTDDSGIEGTGTLTYTLSGPDAASFTIDANGNLTFVAAPDFEAPADSGDDNVYDVTVTVTDSGGLTDTVTIAVTVTDVNEAASIDTDNDGVPDVDDLDDDNDGILDSVELVGSIVEIENLDAGGTQTRSGTQVDDTVDAFARGDVLGVGHSGGVSYSYYVNGTAINLENVDDGATQPRSDAVSADSIAAFNAGNFLGVGLLGTTASYGYYIDGNEVRIDNIDSGGTQTRPNSIVVDTLTAHAEGRFLGIGHSGSVSYAYYVEGDGIRIDNIDSGGTETRPNATVTNTLAAHEEGRLLGISHSGSVSYGYYIVPTDSDNDGTPDYLDLDSDNDGIPDNVEAQSTTGYIAPNGIVDANGVDTAYSSGLTPVNTDGTDNPDYIDTNSDNEGEDDATEAGNPAANPTYADVNGSLDDPTTLPDTDGDLGSGGDVDYRDNLLPPPDTDNDGVPDVDDLDDDNDGILDTVEQPAPQVGWETLENGATGAFNASNVDSTIAAHNAGTLLGVSSNPGNNFGFWVDGSEVRWETFETGVTGAFSAANVVNSIAAHNAGTFLGIGNNGGTNVGFWVDGTDMRFEVMETGATGVLVASNVDNTIAAYNAGMFLGISNNGGNNFGFWVDGSEVHWETLETGATGAFNAASVVNMIAAHNAGTSLGVTNNSGNNVGLYVIFADTDNDGTPDHLDLDSDNDGIPDNVEAQSTTGYIAPNGDAGPGSDGVDTAYIGGLPPEDTDTDLTPDYLDTDSDNEGGDDAAESGNVNAGETYADVNGSLDNGAADLPDIDNDGEASFRDTDESAGVVPTIANGGSVSIPENTTVVTTVVASGTAPITYSIVGGADAALFQIDENTGALSFISAPDYEAPTDSGGDNVYDVTVRASNSFGTDDQPVAVTVTDDVADNDTTPPTPVITGPASHDGSTPFTLTVDFGEDVSGFDSSDLTVGGGSVDSVTGGPQSYVVTITPSGAGDVTVDIPAAAAQDGAGNDSTAATTTTVTYVAPRTAPTITSGGSVSIPENTTVVTTVVASGTAPITYSIVGGADAALFQIDENTGALSFISAPDYEAPTDSGGDNVYDVTVRASNSFGTDDQPVAVTVTDIAESSTLSLPVKAILQGAYDSSSGLMRDNLRSLPDFPLTSPYGGSEATTVGVLGVTGNDAVVDWVLVELRDSSMPTTVVASQAGLLQADGDVVAVNGSAPLTFMLSGGNYYVAVHHRNHLGVMSGTPLSLSTSTTLIDFSTMSDGDSYGSNSQQLLGTLYGLWMGDVNGDNRIIVAGPENEPTDLLETVLAAPGNTGNNQNYMVSAYHVGDINLDGAVVAAGPGNDQNPIIYAVMIHPDNSQMAANFIVAGQVPMVTP